MKKIKNKKIICLLLGIVLFLIGGLLLLGVIHNEKKKMIELGDRLYLKMHQLYHYGENLEYDLEKTKDELVLLTNYDVIGEFVSSDFLSKVNAFLNIQKIEDKYYIKRVGRGLSGYYGTTLKIKKYSKNKISFIAQSKFCEIDYRVSYGDGCRENHYYTIDKPFTIIKEKDTWKVSSYTSVFEFTDSELK